MPSVTFSQLTPLPMFFSSVFMVSAFSAAVPLDVASPSISCWVLMTSVFAFSMFCCMVW